MINRIKALFYSQLLKHLTNHLLFLFWPKEKVVNQEIVLSEPKDKAQMVTSDKNDVCVWYLVKA